MALIVDAGPLVALADRADARHRPVRRLLEKTKEALFLSPFVVAEANYLIAHHLGVGAEVAFLSDVGRGSFTLEPIGSADIERCAVLVERYRDLDIGIADASIVLLAERHRTGRILTFDERHFRAIRPSSGEPFVLLPADERSR